MNQVTERKRLRRRYLHDKRRAYGRMAATIALGFLCVILAGGLLITGSYLIMKRWPVMTDAAGCCFILGLAFVPRLVIEAAGRAFQKWKDEADHLAYVPPVTADTLPADEILVRAADEPPVEQSSVLLRAAQAGLETAKAELLRVSQGE